ncbi:MAG: Calx-beta domain-containing protein [Nitrosopumilaceae archaeon]
MVSNYSVLMVISSLVLLSFSTNALAQEDINQDENYSLELSLYGPNYQGVGAHINPHLYPVVPDQSSEIAETEVAKVVNTLEGCSCVIFRMDDVQDFFMQNLQTTIFADFTSRGEHVSIGPIANFYGTDSIVNDAAEAGEDSGLFEVFDHGWNHTNFSLMTPADQLANMTAAQGILATHFNAPPNVFVPPFNAYNADTISAMVTNNMDIIGSQPGLELDLGDIFMADGTSNITDPSGIYHLPVDAFFEEPQPPSPPIDHTATSILADIDASIAERGYAVVLLHAFEFSQFTGVWPNRVYTDVIDTAQFQDLTDVIDGVIAKGYPIRTFNQVIAFNGTVSVGNVTQTEGNSGTTNFVFNVTRSNNSGSMSVDYTSADNTATSPSDFTAVPTATLNFADSGQLTQTVTVPVNGDTTIELNETFNVNLSNCVGCTIVNGIGVGTITNDDLPIVTIDNVTQVEGNTGTANFVFNVTRSSNVGAMSVDFQTADNTAISPSDYTSLPLTTLNFVNGGVLSKTVTVSVNGDLAVETDETFNVNLSNCVGCTIADNQGEGTITNDDFPNITINDVTLIEGDSGTSNWVFTVTRSANGNDPSVDFQTADNTATAPSDYTALPLSTLNFTPGGPTTQTVTVPVIGDVIIEADKMFNVNLSNCVGCIITDNQGVGTILDNDTVGPNIQNIGTPGSLNGQFSNPSDVATDSTDRIIVADTLNHRIQIFSSTGAHILSFGTPGNMNDQFSSPSSVAVDSTDRIIVADTNNHRIQIFDSAGNHLQTIGSQGTDNGEFSNPRGVAVDSNNRIIVADTGNHRIQIFSSTGAHILSFGTPGNMNDQFSSPSSVAVDSTDRIIVADTNNHRIQIFSSTGAHILNFGSFGSANKEFNAPNGIAVKSADRIIVADTNNHRLQVFNSAGDLLQIIGSQGSDNGEFTLPSGLTADSENRIIVADTGNHRIQIFLANDINDLDSDGIPDFLDNENILNSSRTLGTSHTVIGNVIIQNGAVLIIPNGQSLTIPSTSNIIVLSGGGVLIQTGGTLILVS